MNKGSSQGLLCLLIFISLSCPIPIPAQTNTQRSKLEKNKQDLEQEISYTTNLLNETKKARQVSVNKVIILNNQIHKRERLINNISDQVDQIQGQIGSGHQSLQSLNQRLESLKREYASMIYQAYKNRNSYNPLMFIFAAKDFNQAYQRLKYYQQFCRYRQQQMNRITNTQELINVKISQLETQKTEKLTLLKDKETEKQKLSREKKEKDQVVAQLKQKEKDLRNRLKEKEKALKKLQSAIEALIAEEIRKSTPKAVPGTDKGAPATVYTLTPEEKELSASFSTNRGKLPWPLAKGIISSTFGEHEHPVLKGIRTNNKGINLLTSTGAQARAVFNGTVSAVISIPNLNTVVIIRHGEYLSVYSNLSSVVVKKGDKVKTKQAIGTIVTDLEDSKTEMHFEIWEGKKTLDPQQWLSN